MHRCAFAYTLALASLVGLGLSLSALADDEDGEDGSLFRGPSIARTIDPAELVTGSEDLQPMVFGTDWDEVSAAIGDPTKRLVEPTGFDEKVVQAGDSDEHQTRTHEVMNLAEKLDSSVLRSGPASDAEPLVAPEADDPPAVKARWRELLHAESRLRSANAAYQDMRQADHPRGQQRRWIIDSRNAAISIAHKARSRYAEALTE